MITSAATQKKGRGSQINPHNRFNKITRVHLTELEDEKPVTGNKTKLIETFPKTIINKVNSPDIPFRYSINPYQGCEHGCSYVMPDQHIIIGVIAREQILSRPY